MGKMMENSQISNVKGNRDLKLAPETIRIRDAIVEKYLDTPLDSLSSKLQSLISGETDTATRLGILSARVEILRMRFAEITGRTYKKDQGSVEDSDTEEEETGEDSEEEKEGWMTLRILEASEVNGVRFPEGVKIDVHTEDAKKLLASKKAELLSMKVEDIIDPGQLNEEDPFEDANAASEDGEGPESGPEVTGSEKSSEEELEKEGVKVEELTDPGQDKSDTKETEVETKDSAKENKEQDLGSGGDKEETTQVQDDTTPLKGGSKESETNDSDLEDDSGLKPAELSDLTENQAVTKEPEAPEDNLEPKPSSQVGKAEEDSGNLPAVEDEKQVKGSSKGSTKNNSDKT